MLDGWGRTLDGQELALNERGRSRAETAERTTIVLRTRTKRLRLRLRLRQTDRQTDRLRLRQTKAEFLSF